MVGGGYVLKYSESTLFSHNDEILHKDIINFSSRKHMLPTVFYKFEGEEGNEAESIPANGKIRAPGSIGPSVSHKTTIFRLTDV